MMERMFNNPITSDFKFHLEGKTIHVHRVVLVTTSWYMSQQFSDAWRDTTSTTIGDYSHRVYYLYLHFLYTDRLEVSFDEAIDLYVLARDQAKDQLRHRCVEIIKKDKEFYAVYGYQFD